MARRNASAIDARPLEAEAKRLVGSAYRLRAALHLRRPLDAVGRRAGSARIMLRLLLKREYRVIDLPALLNSEPVG